jgi:hypothetical protein
VVSSPIASQACGAAPGKAGFVSGHSTKINGSDAAVRTVQNNDVLDIGISPGPSGWARGKHVIELDYEAKHQFVICDDFEDFNQDISGEWPIPVDRASVELDFSDGLPPNGASITPRPVQVQIFISTVSGLHCRLE